MGTEWVLVWGLGLAALTGLLSILCFAISGGRKAAFAASGGLVAGFAPLLLFAGPAVLRAMAVLSFISIVVIATLQWRHARMLLFVLSSAIGLFQAFYLLIFIGEWSTGVSGAPPKGGFLDFMILPLTILGVILTLACPLLSTLASGLSIPHATNFTPHHSQSA